MTLLDHLRQARRQQDYSAVIAEIPYMAWLGIRLDNYGFDLLVRQQNTRAPALCFPREGRRQRTQSGTERCLLPCRSRRWA